MFKRKQLFIETTNQGRAESFREAGAQSQKKKGHIEGLQRLRDKKRQWFANYFDDQLMFYFTFLTKNIKY